MKMLTFQIITGESCKICKHGDSFGSLSPVAHPIC